MKPEAQTTLEQLRARYHANYITADQLLADHLPHISSVRYLRRKCDAGLIGINLRRLDPSSNRSPWVVYLHDLAAWLDNQAAQAA